MEESSPEKLEGFSFNTESEIEMIFDSLPAFVFYKDKRGRHIRVNQSFAESVGLPADQWLGKTAVEIFGEMGSGYERDDSEILRTGRAKLNIVEQYPAKDGTIRWARTDKIPHFDDAGRVVGLIGLSIDVTDTIETQRKLEEKNRQMQRFLSVTSHDLRTPLVNVKGFAGELIFSVSKLLEIVRSLDAEPEKAEEIERIVNEDIPEETGFIRTGLEKMDSLLDGLSKLSRIGHAEMDICRVNINELIKKVLGTVRYEINTKRIEVYVGRLEDCNGDGELLNQLFTNLVGNAIRYLSPKRKGIIEISSQPKRGAVEYCVKDNGIGISHKEREKIFEMFGRGDSSRTSDGQGLGLTIVKQIVDRHRGSVRVESEPGEGSAFFVTLEAAK